MAQTIYDADLFRKQEGYAQTEAADVCVQCWYRMPKHVILEAWNFEDDDEKDVNDDVSSSDVTYENEAQETDDE